MIQEAYQEDRENEASDNDLKTEYDIDREKLRDLRELFELYDVDESGFVDAKEIASALKSNYSARQARANVYRRKVEVSALIFMGFCT